MRIFSFRSIVVSIILFSGSFAVAQNDGGPKNGAFAVSSNSGGSNSEHRRLTGARTFDSKKISDITGPASLRSSDKAALQRAQSRLMGTNHGGGGNGDRMKIDDLVTKIFSALVEIEKFHSLVMPDGRIISARGLAKSLRDAISKNDIAVYDSKDALPEDCPLRDYMDSCVEFLSEPDVQQLSLDLGRIKRYFEQNGIRGEKQKEFYFTQQLIHEAFRMAKVPDRNYQYSKNLTYIVDQFFHNEGNLDFFWLSEDPCWTDAKKPEGCPQRMKELIQSKPEHYSAQTTSDDLLDAKFYQVMMRGQVFLTFQKNGNKLEAQRVLRNGTIENSYDCGEISTINFQKSFKCLETTGLFKGSNYLQVEVKKPSNAAMYLNLFFGPNVGHRMGWFK